MSLYSSCVTVTFTQYLYPSLLLCECCPCHKRCRCVAFSVLSISGIVSHSSLMCSSMVAVYCAYYCWSALSGTPSDVRSDDGGACNTLLGDHNNATAVNVVVGLILTCLSLAWSAYSLGASEASLSLSSQPALNSSSAGSNYAELSVEENTEQSAMDFDFGDSSSICPLVRYHFIMTICAMFMTMTVVNWDIHATEQMSYLRDFGTGWTVVWVKSSAQWLAISLYVWTIIAPRVLGMCGVEREFDFAVFD